MYECSWGLVYDGKAKTRIGSIPIEHQQESIKGNWSSSGATEHIKECHGRFGWLHPKTLLIKNSYYDRKFRETLGIDVAVVRYRQNKGLNRDTENFVKKNENTSLKFEVILF